MPLVVAPLRLRALPGACGEMVGNIQYVADVQMTFVTELFPVAVADEPPRRRMADWIPQRMGGLRDRGVPLPARRSVRPARRCSATM